MTAPMAYRWSGETFEPLRRFKAECDNTFVVGEVYRLEEIKERSQISHNHEFAWLKEAWKSLPEDVSDDYPSPDHLRKRALIQAGFFDEIAIDAGSKAAALRFASVLRSDDDFALVIVRGQYVIRRTAKSQSRRAMKAAEFQASKTAVLEIVSELIGVPPGDVQRNAARNAA